MKDWYGPFQFTIITNGLLLTRGRIAALVDAGLKEIVISLNGLSEETHDHTRGVPGGFFKIMQAIQEFKLYEGQITVGIATVLMGYNMAQAEEMVRWVHSNGMNKISFQALFFETGNRAYEKDWHKTSLLWEPKKTNHSEVIDALIHMKKEGYPIANPVEQLEHFKLYFQHPDKDLPVQCRIGIHGFFVDPLGEVKLCYLFDPIGNLLEATPAKIWNSKTARKTRQLIKNCRLNCRLKNCNYVKQ